MADGTDGAKGVDGARRARRASVGRWTVRVLSIGLIALGIHGLEPVAGELPFREPVASPDLERVPALDVAPGALAGRSLVLVTLDTTRPDRLGVYGNADARTPNVDRLAANGVVYTNAVATAPTTVPTHASMLTGLYPWNHGARANGRFALDDGVATLAELLAGRGYDTAAFVSSFVLDRRTGLDRGFDVYDDRAPDAADVGGFRKRRGDATTALAGAWLRERGTAPFFLWIHYYDPHAAYEPPPPFDSLEHPYDGEIAFVDAQIGRLLAALGARAADALVVVTADHGESLGAHGELTHGLLVQEATLRVPLVLYAPGALPRGVAVDDRVSQVDLLPSLLSLLGVPAPDGLDGVDFTRGEIPDRPLFAETLEGATSFGWSPLAAIYAGSLKYVDGPDPELYDLSRDPLEAHDLADVRRDDARALARRLDGARARARGAGTRLAVGAADAAKLQALGYVVSEREPAAASLGADAALPDPKAQLPVWRELQGILEDRDLHDRLPTWMRLLLLLKGRTFPASTAETIERLEAFAAEHPDFVPTQRYLESLYRDEGRAEDAARTAARLDALLGTRASAQ